MGQYDRVTLTKRTKSRDGEERERIWRGPTLDD
jgi:predicted Zn-dependent protease with MMP-like domain